MGFLKQTIPKSATYTCHDGDGTDICFRGNVRIVRNDDGALERSHTCTCTDQATTLVDTYHRHRPRTHHHSSTRHKENRTATVEKQVLQQTLFSICRPHDADVHNLLGILATSSGSYCITSDVRGFYRSASVLHPQNLSYLTPDASGLLLKYSRRGGRQRLHDLGIRN